jgi:hypothetical protein
MNLVKIDICHDVNDNANNFRVPDVIVLEVDVSRSGDLDASVARIVDDTIRDVAIDRASISEV